MIARGIVALGLAASVLLLAAEGRAQPRNAQRNEARALVYAGREHREAGALTQALEDFKKAHALMGVPTTGLELARTQIALGQLLEAKATLTEVVRSAPAASDPPAFANARADGRALLDGLRIPTVTVVVPDEGAQARIDGEVIEIGQPVAVNPGAHEIVVREGGAEKRRTVRLVEGGSETVRVTFTRPAPAPAPLMVVPPPPPETKTNPLVYVGGAVLAAGVATGAVTGFMTLEQKGALADRCATGCSNASADIERGKTLGTISTVSFAVAGAGAAVLVYGLLRPSKREAPIAVRGGSFVF